MRQEKLNEILNDHRLWLRGEGGPRAYLREANLWGANLREAELREANLWGADLRGAYLWEADLWGADLWGANLREADLRGAYLDFSAWPLSCGSFGVKVDDRIVAQLFCHIARLDVSGCSPVVRYAHRVIFSTWPGKWLKNLFSEYRDDVEKI